MKPVRARVAGGARRGAVEAAAERIRGWVFAGEVVEGQDLPGERELAERLGVSRLTLRAALARLASEGLVKPVHGSGTRVMSVRESAGIEALGHWAVHALRRPSCDGHVIVDLLAMRRALAGMVLGLAAERATANDRRTLRAHRVMQGALVADASAFLEADLQFARLLVRATHNVALELLFNTIVRAFEAHPQLPALFLSDPRRTLSAYDRILSLLEARSPARLRRLAVRFLEPLDRATVERLGVSSYRSASERGGDRVEA